VCRALLRNAWLAFTPILPATACHQSHYLETDSRYKVRHSLKYVSWKERKAVATDLRAIYGATTLAEAEQALERFADR
jgi:mutator family transposase